MTPRPIYLDHAASTPVDPRVVDVMLEWLRGGAGNPHNHKHSAGRAAHEACERARDQVRKALGAGKGEVVFTSGATEANNLAILGAAGAAPDVRRHLVTCATEHSSVLGPLSHLESSGWRVTRVGVDREGRLDLDELKRSITDSTLLVSVMWVNNETGAVQDLSEVVTLARARGALVHCDAAQAVGRVAIDLSRADLDFLTLSGHKLYGPMGIGALYVRRAEALCPLLHGGGQQDGMRPGTVNVPGAVGLGLACELAAGELPARAARLAEASSRIARAVTGLGGSVITPTGAAPGILNVAFEGIDPESLLAGVGEAVALSARGSACHSVCAEPSHVLQAMGVPDRLALSAVRFSPGKDTTGEEIDRALHLVAEQVALLRAGSRVA